MINPQPVTLEGPGIRLEPMSLAHSKDLETAVSDGKLWELWYVSTPEPGNVGQYIDTALKGQADGHMLPWVVRELTSGAIIGSTRYHDIVSEIDRVEIGYTFY